MDKAQNISKLKIRTQRYFSEDFKRQVVKDLDSGLTKIGEVVNLYSVSAQSVYNWVYKYSIHHQQGTRQVIEMESESKKNEILQSRLAEYERKVGQQQMVIDYLSKVIELGSLHTGIDLKKNANLPQLNGLEYIKEQ